MKKLTKIILWSLGFLVIVAVYISIINSMVLNLEEERLFEEWQQPQNQEQKIRTESNKGLRGSLGSSVAARAIRPHWYGDILFDGRISDWYIFNTIKLPLEYWGTDFRPSHAYFFSILGVLYLLILIIIIASPKAEKSKDLNTNASIQEKENGVEI